MDFRSRLDQVVRDSCGEDTFRRRMEYDLSVPFSQWTPDSIRQLDVLEPTGCRNPSPLFLLPGVSVQSMRRVGRDLSHLQLNLLSGDRFIKGIAFSQGDAADQGYTDADILYRPILNEFRGRVSVEAQVMALRPL